MFRLVKEVGLDLVEAAFPPGSMTGAPKLAAISLLEDLEPVRRGVYSGAVGYFDQRGGMDLSVVLWTILLQKERACFQVGGAVVADSEAASEYAETIDKVRALWAAVNDVPVPKNDGPAVLANVGLAMLAWPCWPSNAGMAMLCPVLLAWQCWPGLAMLAPQC